MGYLACDLCRVCLLSEDEDKHVCKEEDVRKHFEELQQRMREAEHKTENMVSAVKNLLISLPSLDHEEVTVKTELLKQLYEAVTPNAVPVLNRATWFHSKWFATHFVLTKAFGLFKKKSYTEDKSHLAKLTSLYEACKEAKKVLHYEDSIFDVTLEEFLNGAE